MRRLFQLGLLMLALPIYMLYRQLQPGTSSAGEERVLLDQAIGFWQVALVEQHFPASEDNGTTEVSFREYELQICDDCADTIKAAFISREQPAANEYGQIFSGGPTIFHSRLPSSKAQDPHEKLWLTLEGWNGDIRQVSIP